MTTKMIAHLLLITLAISHVSSQGAGDGSLPSEETTLSTVDLIASFGLNSLPIPSGAAYVSGLNGNPAFYIEKIADLSKTVGGIFPSTLPTNFAIRGIIKPANEHGGFIFALRDATSNRVKVSLNVGLSFFNTTFIALMWDAEGVTKTIARFHVSPFHEKFTRFAIKSHDGILSMYLNCKLLSEEFIWPSPQSLSIADSDVLYLARSGADEEDTKFEGVLQELEITSNPEDAAKYCEEEKSLEYDEEVSGDASGDGSDVPTDEEEDDDSYPFESTEFPDYSDKRDEELLKEEEEIAEEEEDVIGVPIEWLPGSKGEPEKKDEAEETAVGPEGPPKAKGEPGIPGIPGIDGQDGVSGKDGDPGPAGPPGENGDKGDVGAPGVGIVGEKGAVGGPGPKGEPGETTMEEVEGPPGPKGEKGEQGEEGEDGEDGEDGKHGVKGDQGAPGPPGDASFADMEGSGFADVLGPPGEPGAPGAKGEPGLPGLGSTGSKGERGEQGERGEAGPPGSSGTNGSDGRDGASGPQGPSGLPGPTGIPGIPGVDGATGAQGPPGVCVLPSATDAPLDDEDGEGSGIDDPAVMLRNCGTGVTGPTGSAGEQGEKGDTGLIGLTGPKGEPGLTGAQGDPGVQGLVGPEGSHGLDGTNGRDGIDGVDGAQGPRGEPGPPGQPGSPAFDLIDGGQPIQNLKGEKGEPGVILGPDGNMLVTSDGEPGKTGEPGPRGLPGLPGIKGDMGLPGRAGRYGRDGAKGEPGFQGERGEPGIAGTPGQPGPPGPAGSTSSDEGWFGGGRGEKGRPGEKGEPASSSENPGERVFSSVEELQSHFTEVSAGTFAYVSDRQEVYVKTRGGWRRVALDRPLPPPSVDSEIDVTRPASLPPTTIELTTSTSTVATTTTEQPPTVQSSSSIHLIALNYPIRGRMPGIGGADSKCFDQARKAGLRGTYRAFLSSRDQHVQSIVRKQDRLNVPVVNAKGEVLFDNWNAMFDGNEAAIDPYKIYSFENRQVYSDARWPMKIIWHGSDSNGKLNHMHNCASWHTHNTAVTGQASLLDRGKLLGGRAYSCTQSFILLCIENSPRTLRYKKR